MIEINYSMQGLTAKENFWHLHRNRYIDQWKEQNRQHRNYKPTLIPSINL